MSQNEILKNETVDLTKWHVNGHEFTIDMQDLDDVQRYESAFSKLTKSEKTIPADGLASERLLAYCNLFRDLFDDIFGAGASTRIFGEKNNYRLMMEIYEDFLAFIAKQGEVTTAIANRLQARYSPNRAQRRADAKRKQ